MKSLQIPIALMLLLLCVASPLISPTANARSPPKTPPAAKTSPIDLDKMLARLPPEAKAYHDWLTQYLDALRTGKGESFIPGDRIVGFKPGVTKAAAETLATATAAVSSRNIAAFGKLAKTFVYLLKFASEDAAKASEAALRNNPSIKYVAKNEILKLPPVFEKPFKPQAGAVTTTQIGVQAATLDPLRPYQYGLDKVKDNIAPAPPAPTSSDPAVAVLDTGVANDHEDLAGRVIPGTNYLTIDGLLDQNGNLYTPDEIYDDFGHGTHVAGIIGAIRNNNKGIAGLAGNWRIYNDKICDYTGSCPFSAIIAGLNDAASQIFVKIINLSLGGYAYVGSPDWVAICDAVTGAYTAGKIVVAAAGNDDNQGLYQNDFSNGFLGDYEFQELPGGCPAAVRVSATKQEDVRVYRSNYPVTGLLTGVNYVAAPGYDILSTCAPGSAAPDCNWNAGVKYVMMSGTSMASPMAAAVLARIWAKNPSWTDPAMVITQLLTYGVSLGSQAGFPVSLPRVDVAKALGVTGNAYKGVQGYVQDGTFGFFASGAQVKLAGLVTVTGYTTNGGFFTINNVPAGTYTLTVSKAGYVPFTKTGVVVSSFAEDQDFFIAEVMPSDTVTVITQWNAAQPGLGEWDQLVFDHGFEHPAMPETFEAAGARPDLIARVNGLTVYGGSNYNNGGNLASLGIEKDVYAWNFPSESIRYKTVPGRTVEVAVEMSPWGVSWGKVTGHSLTAYVYQGSALKQTIKADSAGGTADFWWQIYSQAGTGAQTSINKRVPLTGVLWSTSWGCDPSSVGCAVRPYVPTTGAKILLVDDSLDWPSWTAWNWYNSSLTTVGATYSYWSVFWLGSPSKADMSAYQGLIWFTGWNGMATFQRYDRQQFTAFITTSGKRAFITGQDIGFDLYLCPYWIPYNFGFWAVIPEADQFYTGVLGANFWYDGVQWVPSPPLPTNPDGSLAGTIPIQGVTGDPITDFLVSTSAGTFLGSGAGLGGADNQGWPDGITANKAVVPSTVAMWYIDPNTGTIMNDGFLNIAAGVRWQVGTGTAARKLLYFSFGYEGITEDDVRAQLMQNTVTWLTT